MLCVSFKLEFEVKTDHVKKKLEIHSINKMLPQYGGRGMGETKLETTNQNPQKN